MKFSHLHVHTQFSLLDGAADISKLYKKAINDDMPAIAITDHGNMFGVFEFVAQAYKHKNAEGNPLVKPIVGCEFYLVDDRHKRSFTKDDKDKRYHQLFLAKNEIGYKNLIKLCSLGYMEGLYSKYPRIDKELVLKYHEGLIATTCCIGAMVPRTILKKGEEEGEKEFKWWLDIFGEDYYIELQRHNIEDQNKVNEVLLKYAAKYNVKIIASNDSHYVDRADANAHDILLCINTGEKQSTPTIKEFADDDVQVKGKRFAFANDEFYFKSTGEMSALFNDLPQAIDNTNEIVDKVQLLNLQRDILLPNYKIPEGFNTQDDYLEHLTYTGAKERYKEITPEIEERLKFELHTIKTMGFAGYFLIVADFIKAGKDMGVFVGPGRGSAAGSAVAYCIGITNIDPIKYDLLFERFLNPERKSMPDIDTDFDDEGRDKVIDYVVKKYGKNQVAHIITYGTMAAKMSIKDVARVLDLPLNESNALAKLVPDKPGISLNRVLTAPLDGEGSIKEKEGLQGEDIENIKKLREILESDELASKVLKEAMVLEGSVRGTGIHAAGIIIAPKDLTDLLPVATAKDVNLLITQYEGNVIESSGVIKMDFLGLRNLSIIKTALKLIKQNHGIDLDIDSIPLDDKKTFALYARGETNGTFQFESAGMQKYLKELKPDRFEDLIAMNALYRPGPMQYIPNFIARKHGKEPVTYDLPEMEEYLKDTYGITVYQEQVMLLSQKLAGFSKGKADILRKAMGKKDRKQIDALKGDFIAGATAKGFDEKILQKIWTDWEAFAMYAFNKSHSTCYAYLAYQTGYLKAHFPSEYMAAVLSNNINNIDKISFFMEECKRIGVEVLGPSINESDLSFSVNNKGQIRFGLNAIKGVGEAAVENIIEERNNNGPFTSIFNLTSRVNLRSVNKKTLEALAYAGAFDCFENVTDRAQYFACLNDDSSNTIEKAIKYGNLVQTNMQANSLSLFGGSSNQKIPEPPLPKTEPWNLLQKLKLEKEVIGIYLSGHPLDTYKLEINNLTSHVLADLKDLEKLKGKELKIAGIVSEVGHKLSQKGTNWGVFTIEDYTDTYKFTLFQKDYIDFKKFMELNYCLFIKARVQNKWNSDSEFELKITGIEMLFEVREKYMNKIKLNIDSNSFKIENINTLLGVIEKNPGNSAIYVSLFEPNEQYTIKMLSTKHKINPKDEVLAVFDSLGVTYTFN
ncbi:MAG: DNA polymerase III subunit alpha [Bacteroidia bacterium]